MKTNPKEISNGTLNYSKQTFSTFDKVEFAGSSLFGVIKKRKTQTLSYEQVFTLENGEKITPLSYRNISKPQQHVTIKRNKKNCNTANFPIPSQNIVNYTATSSTCYSNHQTNANMPITNMPTTSNSPTLSTDHNQFQQPMLKERKMLSLKELLN